MNNPLLTIGMVGGLTGCVFVTLNETLAANLVWLATNPCLVIHNARVGEKKQAVLWGIYSLIALVGVILRW